MSSGRGPRPTHPRCAAVAAACWLLVAACGAPGEHATESWTGAIDTLPSGQIVVQNTEEPIWPTGSEWRVEEEIRIGVLEGAGPNVFGRVTSFDVDAAGTDRGATRARRMVDR